MKSRLLKNIIIVILLVVFIFSATLLVVHFLDYQKNKELYDESVQEFTDTENVMNPADEYAFELSEEQRAVLNTEIDFGALRSVNSEVEGWIIVPNTPINYPLLRGTDNQKYLTRAYDGTYNILGSIFMDYRNSADFSDKNTIIYGHNTSNNSMFGSLNDFVDQDFFENTGYIYIFREGEADVYEVFSAYITDAYSDSYQLKFEEPDSYSDFLKKIEAQSLFKAEVEVESEYQIITLSTCTPSSDKRERIVIHAIRVIY